MTGYGRADLHMHTNVSDGVPGVRELLEHVQHNTRLNVIAITDHDRLEASLWAYERQDNYRFDVIPGVEITSAGGHVLGLWVTRPIPPRLSLKETIIAIHEQDGIAVLAHPYHVQVHDVAFNWLSYTRRPEYLLDIELDAIEVHNAGIMIPGENMLARCLAHMLQIAITGGSDAHTLGAIGSGVTRFAGYTAHDLREAMIRKRTKAEGSAWPIIDYWRYLRHSTHNTSNEFLVENLS